MFLHKIQIRNFRGIRDLTLILDDFCVLIGENNSGKSSVLDALKLCLTRSLTGKGTVFEEYDYHLEDASADPTKAQPIEITLTFAEREKNEWPDEVSQLLSEAEQVNDDELRSITLQVTSRFDTVSNDYIADYNFLDLSGEPLIRAKNPRQIINLQRLVPTFHLASLRDAGKEFRARSQFWGPFVRALELDDRVRTDLENDLLDLNNRVLNQNTAFDNVKERLEKTAQLLPLNNTEPVSIEVIPSRIFDILSRTQVKLASKTGARIPIVRHGSGTQSLAVICLFDAFLQSQLKQNNNEHAKPILVLEEPEAHLHPSAIKAVGEMLQSISGQKLISTHSGDLLASVSLNKICRLRRQNGEIVVHRVKENVLTTDEKEKLDYHIRATRGSLLFSRCWLLVEGETEATLIPECGRAMGHDLDADGISCVEFTKVGIDKFIKLADDLGIEWFVLVDNDSAGKDYAKSARKYLQRRQEEKHIRIIDHGPMEVFLCMEGFGDIYEESISEQKRNNITANKDQDKLQYWHQVLKAQKDRAKPRNALHIASKILKKNETGLEVPVLLQDVIRKVINLARGAG